MSSAPEVRTSDSAPELERYGPENANRANAALSPERNGVVSLPTSIPSASATDETCLAATQSIHLSPYSMTPRTSAFRSIAIPGSIVGLSALSADGPIVVASRKQGEPDTIILSAVDLAGELLWRQQFEGRPETPRVSQTGTMWIAHRHGGEATLTELDQFGNGLRSVNPESSHGDRIGAFVVLHDGFCVAWLPPRVTRDTPSTPVGRVSLHSFEGPHRWFARADMGELSYRGLAEWSADEDFVGKPMKPWFPPEIDVVSRDPLLVSGTRVAVTFDDCPRLHGSGIGVTFIFDIATGHLIERTPPGPHGYKAIPRPNEFLVGLQGYGAFETHHLDETGSSVQSWPSHSMLVVDRAGSFRGPESQNISPSSSHFVVLELDGRVTHGPALNEYYTSYPAIDEYGTTVFWRDGRLVTVDADLKMRTVLAPSSSGEKHSWGSRILLLAEGRLALGLSHFSNSSDLSDLVFVENTGLGALDNSAWPCGEGGLHGNPVLLTSSSDPGNGADPSLGESVS
jgi:hypothetical protein